MRDREFSETAITAGEYESYIDEVLAYVRIDDPDGLAQHLRHIARDAMGLPWAELPLDAAHRIINGAYASAWI